MTHASAQRWLLRIGIAVAALVVLLAIGLWWLLGTGAGLHFALARVTAASDGALSVQSAHGSLAGPLQLGGVRYHDAEGGTDARIKTLQADPSLWSLLSGTVRLRSLAANGVDVALTTPTHPEPESTQPLSLKPPLDVVIDRARIRGIDILRDGKPVFRADTLDVAGAWTSRGLDLRQLKLRSPDGRADLSGRLALARPYRGKGNGSFRWNVDDTVYAGTLTAASDGRQAHLVLALTLPMRADLRLDMQQSGKLPWTAKLTAPAFDPEPLLGDTSLKQLAVALTGHGDRTGGTLTGRIDLDQVSLDLKPLELHYDPDTQKIRLDQLVLTSPQIPGNLKGHGSIDLATQPARADLALAWRDVLLPASVAGQKLASAGDITVQGSADRYRVQGRVDLGPPDQIAHLALDLTGTPKAIALETLSVKQPKGELDVHGKLDLKPQLAWNLDAKGHNFNPGLILSGWNGALNLTLSTQGRITPQGPDATLDLDKLDGTLRQRRLTGHGKLHLAPNRVVNGKLSLASGASRVELDANGTRSNHANLKLGIVSLNDWLPDASGALRGNILVTGLWPKLSVNGHLYGQKLSLSGNQIGKFDLVANVPDLSHPGGKLTMRASHVMLGSMLFDSMTLDGQGDAAHHTLHLAAKGQPLSLRVALAGSMPDKAWSGTLSTLDLDFQGLPPWHLQAPAQLAWNQGQASLSQTCLTAGEPTLCLSAKKARNDALDADYTLHAFPLALVTTLVGEGLPLRAEGVIDGQGKVHRDAAGALSGQATLTSSRGKISYTDRPDLPLLAYRDFHATATLAPQQQHVVLTTTFDQGGYLRGDIRVNGKQQALSGQVTMRMDSLAPIELFTSALANVKGHLDGDFRLGGTLDQPAITGNARLADFAAEVPAVGLKLHDGQVSVATVGSSGSLRIDGHVGSGEGTLTLGGTIAPTGRGNMRLTIQGDKVLAADIPAAKVTVSPDLAIERNQQGLHLTGKLGIDKADVKLEKLPGAGATQASPDVVVVDDHKQQEQQAAMPVSADITVDLGHRTHIEGYGLVGRVSGRLNVHQAPGKAVTGRGQIVINGTYKAYGQDLDIKQGRLLFASTPIDNPGLDIRAIRALHPNATISDNEVVGLQISGTARRPVMTVFSNPPMEQSDALSYLITGKPLSQVKGGEGNMVNAAAQALGSATGDLLAKGIGAKLGIDAGVSNSAALGTAAFTVGKYLSPRLYLSYGVGLFDPGQVITLRYLLSRRWNFEAEQATDFSRASFNYRIEK